MKVEAHQRLTESRNALERAQVALTESPSCGNDSNLWHAVQEIIQAIGELADAVESESEGSK